MEDSPLYDSPLNYTTAGPEVVPVDSRTTVAKVLEDRSHARPSFKTRSAMAMTIKDALREGGSHTFLSSAEQHALDMIVEKMCRVVCGQGEADNWVDIAGYAQLIVMDN